MTRNGKNRIVRTLAAAALVTAGFAASAGSSAEAADLEVTVGQTTVGVEIPVETQDVNGWE